MAPTLQLSATPSTINIGSGQQIVVSWSATNVSSCKGDTSNYNPSPIWRNPGSSGSFSFSPSDSTVLTLICVGDGGSVTKNVSINIIPLPTAPVLSPFSLAVSPGAIVINGSSFEKLSNEPQKKEVVDQSVEDDEMFDIPAFIRKKMK